MGFSGSFSNLMAKNGTTTDKVEISADWVMVEDGNGNTLRIAMTTPVIIDKTVAGPTANGRDQAGTFATSSWVHFYAVYNPIAGTVAGLFSASATTPALPSGYTYKAYLGAVRNDAGAAFETFVQNNQYVSTITKQVPGTIGTTRTLMDMSTNVPTTAKRVDLFISYAAAAVNVSTNYTTDASGLMGRHDFQCDVTTAASTCIPMTISTPQTIWGIKGAGTFTVAVYTSNWSY